MTSEVHETAGSVSKVECLATIRGRGEAKVALFRHLAPLTVNAVIRSLPFDSRVNVQPAMVCLFMDLKVGVEKQRTQFVRGETAYLASAGLLCVFLKDARSERPLNPVGRVEDGLQVFEIVRPGDVVRLSVPVGASQT